MYCLEKYAPKSAKDQFTKLLLLISGGIRQGAKINFIMSYLIRRQVLRNNQRALSKRDKLWKYLKFDSGCTVCQSTPQNLLYINLPNFLGWFHEPLEKEQKLFLSTLPNSKIIFIHKRKSTTNQRKTPKMS